MDWAGKQHPVETLTEWLAPAALAGAAGWSAASVGLSQAVVALGALGALGLGLLAMRLAGLSTAAAAPDFEPLSFGDIEPALDELLLDEPLDEAADEDELLLDDPLTDIGEDARVVRLFARQEPTPGELVARIEDFLGEESRRAPTRPDILPARPIPDAGAALQAALANVRASLK